MRKTSLIIALTIIVLPLCQGAVIRVPGDQPTIQAGIDAAVAGDTIVVAPGTYTGIGNRGIVIGKPITVLSEVEPQACVIDCENEANGFRIGSDDVTIRGLTITRGSADSSGGGIDCFGSYQVKILDCIVTDNRASWDGGGISFYNSTAEVSNCNISGNTAQADFENTWGGGIANWTSDVLIANCIITGNQVLNASYPGLAEGYGGGIGGGGSLSIILNCLVLDNDSESGAGGIDLGGNVSILNTIVRGNLTGQLALYGEHLVRYSDVEGGYPGDGNIDADPLFVSGLPGEYCLSQTAAGQAMDSPCADSGSEFSASICIPGLGSEFCMDSLTTRTDNGIDSSIVDMGFHYTSSLPTPTPTPAPSPTSSQWIGVQVTLSGDMFSAGDIFKLNVSCRGNPGDLYAEMFVVLDVFGDFWFWPLWTPDSQGLLIALQPDQPVTFSILDFQWPHGDFGEVTGLKFWAAICRPGTFQAIGEIGWAEFGYY